LLKAIPAKSANAIPNVFLILLLPLSTNSAQLLPIRSNLVQFDVDTKALILAYGHNLSGVKYYRILQIVLQFPGGLFLTG